MKLTPTELAQNDFLLIDELPHSEMTAFVVKYLKKNTIYTLLYYTSLLLSLAALFLCFAKYCQAEILSFRDVLSNISLGVFVTLALIPIHEIIHAIVYKWRGAKQVSFDADWKKFVVFAIAQEFVAGKRDMQIVALAPFVTLSLVLIGLAFIVPPQAVIVILTTLMMHSWICAGDFAMLGYYAFHKDREIVSYDDREKKISYFYGRRKA